MNAREELVKLISVLTRVHTVFHRFTKAFLVGERKYRIGQQLRMAQVHVTIPGLVTVSVCIRAKRKAVCRSESDAMLAQTGEPRRERIPVLF